jgi:predicted nucleic acid-binding protein
MVEQGEEVRITRHGKEVVRMLPVRRKPVITDEQIARELEQIQALQRSIRPATAADEAPLCARPDGARHERFRARCLRHRRLAAARARQRHTERLYTRIRRDEVDPQAPNLWQWECGNLIASGVNNGRSAGSVEGLWGVLEAIRHRVELHDLAPAQHKAVLDVALDTGLPTYDAAYLWLAQSLRLPLATFDAAQMAAARKSGVTAGSRRFLIPFCHPCP